MQNHFRQVVDIVLVVGDYWGVVINGDLKAKEDHRKPDNCDQGMKTLVEIQAGDVTGNAL